MTLFNLAMKNIQRNLKDYALYIGSTIFSIIIYFTFATLKYSDNLDSSLGSYSKPISSLMSASSVILIIFVAIFIIYSNSFFIKKRKKEVALYSLLGIRKRAIGMMLFFENLVIGFVSLVIGSLLGFFASGLLLQVLLKLMGLDLNVTLIFSEDALLNTIIVFALIFIFTSIQGYRVIYQFKLVDLFHAAKKGEALPRGRFITFVLGVAILAGAYSLAMADPMTSKVWHIFGISLPVVIILLTIMGTYLLFHSVLVFVLSKLKGRVRWSWKGLNLLTSSQLLYRIRGNAKTLTIIAILSATTITSGGAIFGLYYNIEGDVDSNMPHTFMWQGEPDEIQGDVVYQGKLQAKKLPETDESTPYQFEAISVSTYNELAKHLQLAPIESLGQDELFIVDTYYNERFSGYKDTYNFENNLFTVKEISTQSVVNAKPMFNSLVVVADETYGNFTSEPVTYQYVEVEDFTNQQALSAQLAEGKEAFSSATDKYYEMIQSNGALLFVGSFLGLVFLVATGSIIFFKMMTEAEEDREKFHILSKIGVSKKGMLKTIRQQVGVIFFVPLVLGILHAAVALTALSNLLMMDILVPVILWMVMYTLIYGVYYIVTVRSYYNSTRSVSELNLVSRSGSIFKAKKTNIESVRN